MRRAGQPHRAESELLQCERVELPFTDVHLPALVDPRRTHPRARVREGAGSCNIEAVGARVARLRATRGALGGLWLVEWLLVRGREST